MKLHTHLWQIAYREHLLFAGYRWISWLLACLAVSIPAAQTVHPAGLTWLLVLTCALNLVATITARAYLRVVQRRAWIVSIDVLIGLAIVWLSGGNWLPFMPYALGALVVPGLLMGWRAALTSALGFALLDSVALLTTALQSSRLSLTALLVRFAVPLAFVSSVAGVRYLLSMRRTTTSDRLPENSDSQVEQDASPLLVRDHFGSVAELRAAKREPDLPREAPSGVELMPVREAPERSNQDFRRAICSVTAGPDVELAVALEQLVGNFNRNNEVEVRLNLLGRVQPLSYAQQVVMFRLAQESLLNVQQHARAHAAQLTLRYDPQSVTLTVQDDGVGLLDGTYERPGLHSLRAMYYRLAELDGKLQVYEGESGGVVVCGLLPLDP